MLRYAINNLLLTKIIFFVIIAIVGNDSFPIALENLEVALNMKESQSYQLTLCQLNTRIDKIKAQHPKSLALSYAILIADNLPEWNYSQICLDIEKATKVTNQKLFLLAFASKINHELPPAEQLKLLSSFIGNHVPDNHIDIKVDGVSYVPKTHPSYGKKDFNLAYKPLQNLTKLGLSDIQLFPIQSKNTPWIIAKKGNTCIVAIPSFNENIQTEAEREQLQTQKAEFVKQFFNTIKNNSNNIVFDFRGNTGGDCEVIKEIAERMSQTQLKYSDTCEIITPRTQAEEQKKIFANKEHLNTHYQGNPSDKFNGNIYVLQDGWNASATEGAIYMLSQLKNASFIGEKTSGTFAGGCCVEIPMEVGSLIIGTEYRTCAQNNAPIREKEGFKPTIACSSGMAFDCVLNEIKSNNDSIRSKQQNLHKRNNFNRQQKAIS